MKATSDQVSTVPAARQAFQLPLTREFLTVVLSTAALIVACRLFAPSSVTYGAFSGSLPFAAILAIVGLGQMLVVQQGGFDLSVAGGVSLAVVISTHVTAGNNADLLPAVLMAFGCALVIGAVNGVMVGLLHLNSIVATIGMNALIYGGVFAVSGGVPRSTCTLLAAIAGGDTLGVGNSIYFALAILVIVVFIMKTKCSSFPPS
jgi:ribose transport system permease protein